MNTKWFALSGCMASVSYPPLSFASTMYKSNVLAKSRSLAPASLEILSQGIHCYIWTQVWASVTDLDAAVPISFGMRQIPLAMWHRCSNTCGYLIRQIYWTQGLETLKKSWKHKTSGQITTVLVCSVKECGHMKWENSEGKFRLAARISYGEKACSVRLVNMTGTCWYQLFIILRLKRVKNHHWCGMPVASNGQL